MFISSPANKIYTRLIQYVLLVGVSLISILLIVVIFISACMHATWNFFAKRSNGGFVFVGMYMGLSTIIYAPFVIGLFFVKGYSFDMIDFWFILGTTVIHLAYSLTLQRGYKVGDLSVVYPVARGIAPVLVAIFAVIIYSETLSILVMIGIFFITLSIVILSGGMKIVKTKQTFIGLIYGIVIGMMIASYTLFDKSAVSIFLVPPLLLQTGGVVGQFLFLIPYMLRHKDQVAIEWRDHRKEIFGVAILNPLAYILVLSVMVVAPVSHVAPLREMSILIGVLLGTYVLKESFGKIRIVAALMMILGVVAIATSH